METGYSNRGGWFNDRPQSTGASSYLNGIPKYFLAASLLVAAGTGAFADDLSRIQQHRPNASTITNPIKICTVDTSITRTPSEDIERIRNVLRPAMSDLAKSFNVSRQTIYNWLNGEQPTPENTDRLKSLALVADTFADAGIAVNGILLKRKIMDGKSLFEVVQSGGSAIGAAQLMVQIVKRESEQKERLAARFAGRTASLSSADSDVMAANDVV